MIDRSIYSSISGGGGVPLFHEVVGGVVYQKLLSKGVGLFPVYIFQDLTDKFQNVSTVISLTWDGISLPRDELHWSAIINRCITLTWSCNPLFRDALQGYALKLLLPVRTFSSQQEGLGSILDPIKPKMFNTRRLCSFAMHTAVTGVRTTLKMEVPN